MEDAFTDIIDIVNGLTPITLEEMDRVELMNRMDTKYIFHAGRLPLILKKASEYYRVLSIKDTRIFRYNSLYFDTPELKSYYDHHNGVRPRNKVRFREYEDTGSIYLEVKRKITTDRTRKSRIQVEKIENELSGNSISYIEEKSPFNASELTASLWTLFRRITLVGIQNPERITIDIDLLFRYQDQEKTLPFLVICEVKRDQSKGLTEFMRILKSERIYPGSSSKYCLGTILVKSPRKINNFKENIRKIKKIGNVDQSYLATG